MAEINGATISDYANELDMPFEMTNEQWLDALVNDREPARGEYVDSSIAQAEAYATEQYAYRGIDELERHANALATRENAEHARNVENARTIGQVAGLICSYRDVELAA